MVWFWVALGGALGSIGRYGVGELLPERDGTDFPRAILLVNTVGSLMIGLFAGLIATDSRWNQPGFREFLIIGFCGGFTTFSTFSLQTLKLLHAQQWIKATGNITLSVVICIGCTGLGLWCAQMLKPNQP